MCVICKHSADDSVLVSPVLYNNLGQEHSIGLGFGQNSLLVCYLLALCPLLTIVSWWAKYHRTVFALEHSIGLGPALSQNSYDVGHIKH